MCMHICMYNMFYNPKQSNIMLIIKRDSTLHVYGKCESSHYLKVEDAE